MWVTLGNREAAKGDFIKVAELAVEQGDGDLIDAVEHHVETIRKIVGYT